MCTYVHVLIIIHACMHTYIHTYNNNKKDNLKFKLLVSTENRNGLIAASFVQFISAKVPITLLKNLLYIVSQNILT